MGLNNKILQLEMDNRELANATSKSGEYGGDLTSLVEQWAVKTVHMLKKNIEKKGLVVTRELVDSLRYEFNEGSPPSISLYFSGHGKYLDMKELFWHKPPPHRLLLNWVKKVPFSEWAYVPGYKNMNGIDVEKAQSRIAWGIAHDRARGEAVNQYGRWKRKKIWQNPKANKSAEGNLGTAIGHLRHLLEEEIAELTENIIVYTISE